MPPSPSSSIYHDCKFSTLNDTYLRKSYLNDQPHMSTMYIIALVHIVCDFPCLFLIGILLVFVSDLAMKLSKLNQHFKNNLWI